MKYLQSHSLRLVSFNVENLFVLMDHHQGENVLSMPEIQWQRMTASTTENKALAQILGVAKAIRDMKADIVMLCEVGGKESLSNFSQHFLAGEYTPYLIEGNSDRGIDVGYLVRKSLPFKYDMLSHKNRPLDFLYPHEHQTKETDYTEVSAGKISSHKFSRDVVELRIYENGETKPALVLMLVHLKSALDKERIDPSGRDRRRAELEKLVQIYKEVDAEFLSEVPIVVAGDFNGNAARPTPDTEFEAIYRDSELKDVLEIVGTPVEDRFTFIQAHSTRPARHRQLDYIFVSPNLHASIVKEQTKIFRYIDDFGMPMLVPRNLNEKRLLPSDHYPVLLTLGKP